MSLMALQTLPALLVPTADGTGLILIGTAVVAVAVRPFWPLRARFLFIGVYGLDSNKVILRQTGPLWGDAEAPVGLPEVAGPGAAGVKRAGMCRTVQSEGRVDGWGQWKENGSRKGGQEKEPQTGEDRDLLETTTGELLLG